MGNADAVSSPTHRETTLLPPGELVRLPPALSGRTADDDALDDAATASGAAAALVAAASRADHRAAVPSDDEAEEKDNDGGSDETSESLLEGPLEFDSSLTIVRLDQARRN